MGLYPYGSKSVIYSTLGPKVYDYGTYLGPFAAPESGIQDMLTAHVEAAVKSPEEVLSLGKLRAFDASWCVRSRASHVLISNYLFVYLAMHLSIHLSIRLYSLSS